MKKLHSAWVNFHRILNHKGKATARCKKCGKSYSKIDKEFLESHSKSCSLDNAEGDTSSIAMGAGEPLHERTNSQEELISEDLDGDSSVGSSTISRPRERTVSRSSVNSHSELVSPIPSTSRNSQENDPTDSSLSSSNLSFTSEHEVVRRRAPPKKKRKVTLDSENDLPCYTDQEKEIAIFEFFTSVDLPFEKKTVERYKKMISKFDPQFAVPSIDKLVTNVSRKAADDVYRRNHSKQHHRILQIIVEVETEHEVTTENGARIVVSESVMAISILKSEKDYTFVKSVRFSSRGNEDDTTKIQTFCDESVLEVKKAYNVDVLFVLHSGRYNLLETSTVLYEDDQELKYYTLVEILPVLDELKDCELIMTLSNRAEVNRYIEIVEDTLMKKATSSNVTMAEVVEDLLNAIDNLDSTNKTTMIKKLSEILKAQQIATKVFNPSYHKSLLDTEPFRDIDSVFRRFYMLHGPVDIYDEISFYLNKEGSYFPLLFSQNKHEHPHNFWKACRLNPDLPNINYLVEYGLQIMSIPSKLEKLNLHDMFKIRDKHVQDDDFENMLFNYLIEFS